MLKSQNKDVACFSLGHTYSFGANKKSSLSCSFFIWHYVIHLQKDLLMKHILQGNVFCSGSS